MRLASVQNFLEWHLSFDISNIKINPLSDYSQYSTGLMKYSYFLELVPTEYISWGGLSVLHTHQYSVTNYTEELKIDPKLQSLPG